MSRRRPAPRAGRRDGVEEYSGVERGGRDADVRSENGSTRGGGGATRRVARSRKHRRGSARRDGRQWGDATRHIAVPHASRCQAETCFLNLEVLLRREDFQNGFQNGTNGGKLLHSQAGSRVCVITISLSITRALPIQSSSIISTHTHSHSFTCGCVVHIYLENEYNSVRRRLALARTTRLSI